MKPPNTTHNILHTSYFGTMQNMTDKEIRLQHNNVSNHLRMRVCMHLWTTLIDQLYAYLYAPFKSCIQLLIYIHASTYMNTYKIIVYIYRKHKKFIASTNLFIITMYFYIFINHSITLPLDFFLFLSW